MSSHGAKTRVAVGFAGQSVADLTSSPACAGAAIASAAAPAVTSATSARLMCFMRYLPAGCL